MIRIGIAAGMIKRFRHNELSHLAGLASHITFGSFTEQARIGNPDAYYYDEATHTSINKLGLPNEGLLHFLANDIQDCAQTLRNASTDDTDRTKLRVSIAPLRGGNISRMYEHMKSCTWSFDCIDEIELNVSCRNVENNIFKKGIYLGLLELYMMEAQAIPLRKALKIPPDIPEDQLQDIVRLCHTYDFDTIVSSNTRLGDMRIPGFPDEGSIGGAPLLLPGIAQVKKLRTLAKKSLTIIGCGGIHTAADIHQYESAGADEVQVATYYLQYAERGLRDLYMQLYQ